MKRTLEVRRGAEGIGVLTFTKAGDVSLRYTTAFLGQREAGRPGLSCSLPVIDHVAEVATSEHPLGVLDDSELSLAGVQNKMFDASS